MDLQEYRDVLCDLCGQVHRVENGAYFTCTAPDKVNHIVVAGLGNTVLQTSRLKTVQDILGQVELD